MNFLSKLFNDKNYIIDVVDIMGNITYNDKHMATSTGCVALDVLRILRDVLNDDDANHVVLFHINSPGGSAAAAEEIAELIHKLRNNHIYTVASIGDVGCSAAYLIASQCNYVFANKMSLLGSIGVLMPIPNISKLSEKLGVTVHYLKSGKMKDLGNMFRDLAEEEKTYIESILQAAHKYFIFLIRRYRRIENDDLLDGRFINFDEALNNNFVDKQGNFDDAVEHILNKLQRSRKEVKFKHHIKKSSLIQKIISSSLLT